MTTLYIYKIIYFSSSVPRNRRRVLAFALIRIPSPVSSKASPKNERRCLNSFPSANSQSTYLYFNEHSLATLSTRAPQRKHVFRLFHHRSAVAFRRGAIISCKGKGTKKRRVKIQLFRRTNNAEIRFEDFSMSLIPSGGETSVF